MIGVTVCTSNKAFQLSIFMLHMEHIMPLYKLDHWILILYLKKRLAFIIFILTLFYANPHSNFIVLNGSKGALL